MNHLQDKVAVITGGNSGIGKGIAKRFYQEGARVVIFGRNQQELAQASQEMANDILTVAGDVTRTEDLKNLFKTTQEIYGKIDTLVVNA